MKYSQTTKLKLLLSQTYICNMKGTKNSTHCEIKLNSTIVHFRLHVAK